MVIFSASIVSNRKILLSRQFIEMTRGDVESYLNKFIKKISSYSLSNEYTYVEIENIRFIYQALDSIYLILMTPLNSNIIEDMDTLQLFCQVLYDCCNNPPPITEDLIASNCFEVIFAFDEIISFGYRESVNLSQIKTCLEMESQEEKLHKIIRQNKENEERERRKHIAIKLEKERAVNESSNQSSYTGISSNNNIVKSSLSGIAAFAESVGVGKFAQSVGIATIKNPPKNDVITAMNNDTSTNLNFGKFVYDTSNIQSINAPERGMLIGKKKPVTESRQIIHPDPYINNISDSQSKDTEEKADGSLFEDESSLLEEKVELSLNIDGSTKSKPDIQGTLQITLESENFPQYSIIEDQRFQFKTHPNLNKEKFASSGVLLLKDGISGALPINTFIPLIKWRRSPKFQDSEFDLPFLFSCWPLDVGNGTFSITIEIESTQCISDLKVEIPIDSISISNLNIGEFNSKGGQFAWTVPQLLKSETAVIEFTTQQKNFLPMHIYATASQTLCKLRIMKGKVNITPKSAVSRYNVIVN
ncbi:Coatomer subunit delta [Cryptosporidium felis]|nr:Coatomer subunit delta [Cryptosporidium felis]